MNTFVVISDAHLEHDEQPHPSYLLVKKFIKSIKPDVVYINGDLMDMSYLSTYTAEAELARENKRLLLDYDVLNKELDFFQKHSKQVHYLEGNHESRAQRNIDKMMNYGELLSIPRNTKLEERGIPWYQEHEQPIEITEDLVIAHGFFINVHFAKKSVESMGRSIILGHTHRRQEYTYRYFGGEIVTGHGLGCLCGLNPAFMKSKNSGHSNGFGVGYITDKGVHFDNILIKNNSFVHGGKLWTL